VTEVTAGAGVVVKKLMAYPTFSGRRVTSAIGARSGALVATNGDFPVLGTHAPKHQAVLDGEILSTGSPRQPGVVLRTDADGARAEIGPPVFDVSVIQGGEVLFALAGWNAQQPSPGRTVAFTARGGTSRRPSARNCSALLAPGDDIEGEVRRYEVVEVRRHCGRLPIQPPAGRFDWVVLHGRAAGWLEAGPVRLRVDVGMDGDAVQVLGGIPIVVQDGENVGRRCPVGGCASGGSVFNRHPRTAVGITRGCTDRDGGTPCTYLLMTADGRQRRWSRGIRLRALGRLMVEQGAWAAMNLDGGGSTTMWTRRRTRACQVRRPVGCLVNRPSQPERRVMDAVGVVPVAEG
jgi:hypothetical protein